MGRPGDGEKGIAQQLRAGRREGAGAGYFREHVFYYTGLNTSAGRTNGTRPTTNTEKEN